MKKLALYASTKALDGAQRLAKIGVQSSAVGRQTQSMLSLGHTFSNKLLKDHNKRSKK